MDKVILNKNYSLHKIDHITYESIMETTDKDKQIYVNGILYNRGSILRGFNRQLNPYIQRSQLLCKTILGAGKLIERRTSKGEQFTEYPLEWVCYMNYMKGKEMAGVYNEKDMGNSLSWNKHTLPVMSFNSAIELLKLKPNEYVVLILNQK